MTPLRLVVPQHGAALAAEASARRVTRNNVVVGIKLLDRLVLPPVSARLDRQYDETDLILSSPRSILSVSVLPIKFDVPM